MSTDCVCALNSGWQTHEAEIRFRGAANLAVFKACELQGRVSRLGGFFVGYDGRFFRGPRCEDRPLFDRFRRGGGADVCGRDNSWVPDPLVFEGPGLESTSCTASPRQSSALNLTLQPIFVITAPDTTTSPWGAS